MSTVVLCGDGDCDGPFPGTWVGSDGGAGDGSGVLSAKGDPVSSTAAAEIEQAVAVIVGLHVSVTVTVDVDVAMGLVLFIAELSIAAKVAVTVVSTGVVAGGCEEDFLPTSLGTLDFFRSLLSESLPEELFLSDIRRPFSLFLFKFLFKFLFRFFLFFFSYHC